MSVAPSLRAQVEAVERAASNHDGHVKNMRDLVNHGRRPQHDYDIAAAWLPALKAAAVTMRKMLAIVDEGAK